MMTDVDILSISNLCVDDAKPLVLWLKTFQLYFMNSRKLAFLAAIWIAAAPTYVMAKDAVVKTTEGIGVTYALNASDKIARVKGYEETLKKTITIPSKIKVDGVSYTITKIGAGAFKDADFTTVNLPNTVTLIDKDAFLDSWVKNLTIPPKVEKIGANAFKDARLTSVNIPGTCSELGDYALSMSSLKSVTFDNSTAKLKIGERALYGTSITSLVLPYRVISIGEGAFSRTEITEIVWPDNITVVPALCFYHCNALRSVTLPLGITAIGAQAFEECISLSTINLSSPLTTIGRWAFCRTALTAVNIPEGVVSIGDDAFSTCEQLRSVSLPSTLKSIGECCFQGSESIESVSCDALVPSVCGNSPFSTKTFHNAKIYVPQSVWELYYNTDWWYCFDYTGYKGSGIEDIEDTDNEAVDVEYFDMQGNRVANPISGQIYIRIERTPEGVRTRTKVIL